MTIAIKPSLGATFKPYSYGSNACFKAVTIGGPTPTQITDTSGRGNHGVFTNAPTPALVGDLWTYQFVSEQSNYVTVPDITELLGATAATWCAWVRKDAYVANQCVASDFNAAGSQRWLFGREYDHATDWYVAVGDGTNTQTASVSLSYAVGWHFVWMRFTGSSATGLETGVDEAVATPKSTVSVAALGTGVKNQTYIGRYPLAAAYSSITLAALGIAARALTDEQIAIWREKYRPLIGV